MTIALTALGEDNWEYVMSNAVGRWRRKSEPWPALTPRLPAPERDAGAETKPFSYEDVVEVVASWETEDEGEWSEWEGVALLRLNDGRWAVVSGWCDTTGWGCQDGVAYYASDDYDALVRFGMDDRERASLGISLPATAD